MENKITKWTICGLFNIKSHPKDLVKGLNEIRYHPDFPIKRRINVFSEHFLHQMRQLDSDRNIRALS